MKTLHQTKFLVIQEESAKAFQDALNEALESIADKNPKMVFNVGMGHCVYITYQESVDVPEDIRDEYHLQGIKFHCYECPHFIPPVDRRRRYGECELKVTARPDDEVCLHFYRMYALGEIEPIGGEK